MLTYIAYALFGLGCLVSLINFYLSFLRYPIFRLRGGAADDYQWVSGLPMIGSLLIVLTLAFVFSNVWLRFFGITCAVVDTAGLHWFAGTMLYMRWRGEN